jgi:phosphoketolase
MQANHYAASRSKVSDTAEIDGLKCEGYGRAHQVPMGDTDKPEHLKILEQWTKSYRPEELFDRIGTFKEELAVLAPQGHHRMSDNRCDSRQAACTQALDRTTRR